MAGSRVLGCKCRVWGGGVVFSVWDVRLDILSASVTANHTHTLQLEVRSA